MQLLRLSQQLIICSQQLIILDCDSPEYTVYL